MSEKCRHDEIIFEPPDRGPETTVTCTICGAHWSISSGVGIVLKYILDQLEVLSES